MDEISTNDDDEGERRERAQSLCDIMEDPESMPVLTKLMEIEDK